MSRTDAIVKGAPLPLIVAVEAADQFSLRVDWQGGPSGQIVDIAPDVMTFKAYAPLRKDRRLFETVEVVEDGNAVAWEGGAIDMPATAIERLAGAPARALDDAIPSRA